MSATDQRSCQRQVLWGHGDFCVRPPNLWKLAGCTVLLCLQMLLLGIRPTRKNEGPCYKVMLTSWRWAGANAWQPSRTGLWLQESASSPRGTPEAILGLNWAFSAFLIWRRDLHRSASKLAGPFPTFPFPLVGLDCHLCPQHSAPVQTSAFEVCA